MYITVPNALDYTVVFNALFDFTGNLLVIYVVLRHKKMRTTTNFFLANLAVADLSVGFFCVLPNLALYLSPFWLLGKVNHSFDARHNVECIISV